MRRDRRRRRMKSGRIRCGTSRGVSMIKHVGDIKAAGRKGVWSKNKRLRSKRSERKNV